MIYAVLHNLAFPVFPSTEHGPLQCIARGEGEGSDLELCELAFQATNAIDSPWYDRENQLRYGLRDVIPSRSTSVGDVVAIEDPAGTRYYRCEMVGWRAIDELDSQPHQTFTPGS